ncbi:MAG: HEAT repeat domain-containing protein [Planctomycetota bacterium]
MASTPSILCCCLLLTGADPSAPGTSLVPQTPNGEVTRSVILNEGPLPELQPAPPRPPRGAGWLRRLLPRVSGKDQELEAPPAGHVPLDATMRGQESIGPSAASAVAETDTPAAANEAIPEGFIKLDQKKIATPIRKLSNEELLSWLHKPSWVRATDGQDLPLVPDSPWHQPFVTELVDRCLANEETRRRVEPEFRLGLASRTNAELRASCALGLVLLGRPEGLEELNRIALDGTSAVPKRVTAFYALASMPTQISMERLGALFDTWFPAPKASNAAEDRNPSGVDRTRRSVAMVSSELVAGVLWAYVSTALENPNFEPDKDPLLARAIEYGDEASRRIAAVAFSQSTWKEIPLPLSMLLRDLDPKVRRAAVEALGTHATKEGEEKILLATFDNDPLVRSSAIALLAKYSDAQVTQRLEELSLSEHPIDRQAIAAVAGLRGIDVMLRRLAVDPSWTVRRAVAESLGTSPSESSAKLLTELLDDRSPEVQEAAVRSFALRPRDEAVEGLLLALSSTTLSTRRVAAEKIGQHWSAADKFPVLENPPTREAEHRRLVELWAKENKTRGPAASVRANTTPKISDSRNIERLLLDWYRQGFVDRTQLAKELVSHGPELLPILEDFHLRRQSYPSAELLRHVCAPLDPVYKLLADLFDAPPGSRSATASRLRLSLRDRRLTEMQAVLVSEFVAITGDRTSWIELVPLLERDCPREAARLDGEGTRHPDPILRQTTCERIGKRADIEHLPLLQPLFRDPHATVRIAALDAASTINDKAVVIALQEAIVTREPEVRLAAAAGLHRHGISAGTEELVRLARDPNPAIRRAVIQRVSEQASLDPQSAIRLFTQALDDDKLSVKQQAIAGLQSLLGKDFQRDKFGRSLPLEAQIAQWNHALQSANLSGELPATLIQNAGLDE